MTDESTSSSHCFASGAVGARFSIDITKRLWHSLCVDAELPLNDDRVELRKGSKAWRAHEWERYREAMWKFEGIFPPYLAAFQLGVSRQRVYQMFDSGILERLEFFGHSFVRGDEIDGLNVMEKERRTPGFRIQNPA